MPAFFPSGSLFYTDSFEKCVTEDTFRPCSPGEVTYPPVKVLGRHHFPSKNLIPDTLDHGSERLPCKTARQVRSRPVDVDLPWRDVYVPESCRREERIEFPANPGISPHFPLEFLEAADTIVRMRAPGIEKGGSMVSFDDSQCSALCEDSSHGGECSGWIPEMFEDKTEKNMVEHLIRKG